MIQDFYSNIVLYSIYTKKYSLRKFRNDFLMILVDVSLFKDPHPVFSGYGSRFSKSPGSSGSGSATLVDGQLTKRCSCGSLESLG